MKRLIINKFNKMAIPKQYTDLIGTTQTFGGGLSRDEYEAKEQIDEYLKANDYE